MRPPIGMFRIPEHLKERIYMIHGRIESKMARVPIDISKILRYVMEQGVISVEKELGVDVK
jgi:hypothetical protein